MNVTVKNVDDPAKGTHLKALVLAKDVKAGEIIYKVSRTPPPKFPQNAKTRCRNNR